MSLDIRKPSYQPGICNIGPEEIQKRKRIGYIGSALTIIFIIAAAWYDLPQAWKWTIFAPVAYAASGFVQARNKFCFLFGISGISRIDQNYIRTKTAESKSADTYKSMKLIAEIVIISALLTVVYVFVS